MPRSDLDAREGWSRWGARMGVCVALAGSWLCFSILQTATYSLPKLVALAAGCWLAWTFLWVGAAKGEVVPRRTALDPAFICLAAVGAASACLGDDPVLSLVGRFRMYAYGLTALALYVGLFYASAWSREPGTPAVARCLVAAGAFAGGYAVLQAGGVEPFVAMARRLPEGRAIATMGSPVYLGSCLLMALPLALYLALDGAGLDRFLGWVGGFFIASGLVLTYSRGAWLGAALGVLAFLWWTGRLRLPAGPKSLAASAVAAGLAVLLLAAGVSRLRKTTASDFGRLHLWASAWGVVREKPWLGTGPDNFEAALRRHKTLGFMRHTGITSGQSNAHNDLIQALATTGLLGLAAYLWVLWGAARLLAEALADPARRTLAAAVGGALAGLFLQAKLNPTSLPSLAAAAALCGLLASGFGPGWRPTLRWAPLVPWLASSVALAGSLRLALADFHQRKALVFQSVGRFDLAGREFPQAIRLHPYETDYRAAYWRFLIQSAERTSDAALRLAFLEQAALLGEEAVRLRPAHIDGYQMLGAGLYELSRAGGPDRLEEAERALDRALELDQAFPSLLDNRVKLARLRGDAAGAAEFERRLLELRRLGQGTP